MHFHRLAPALLATAIFASGCGEKAPVPEEKAVLDSYEVALFVPDPDINTLLLHAAWLGPDSVRPILKIWPTVTTNEVKRVKLTKVLEILAWNGFRTQESVKILASLSRDKQPQVRKSAVTGLFASMADLNALDKYWDPSDATPERTWNPAVALRLPFSNCRELLAQRGVAIAKGPDGAIVGEAGRSHAAQPPVAEAAAAVRRWWNSESDSSLRIYSAILAIRTQDAAAAGLLVQVLKPSSEGTKPSAQLEGARACSLRALQEATGERFSTWDQWDAWLAKNRAKASPPPPREIRPPQPPPGATK